MKIYTRTGDGGETGLFDGTRVSKADARVATYGDVDEVNAWIGFARARLTDQPDIVEILVEVQRDLFALGARLADPRRKIADRVTKTSIGPSAITKLEGWIDSFESTLPPLRRFILAGGSEAGSALHVARTVCRRAERAIVALQADHGAVEPEMLVYVNRLSDLLFVVARLVNLRAHAPEIEW